MPSNKINFLHLAFYAWIIFMMSACGDKEPKTSPEDNLRISVDAGSMVIIPGPDYDLTVNVLSAMPAKGVQIDVEVKGEVNGQIYYLSPGILSSAKSTVVKLSFLPRQVICICKVTVTSKGDAKNKTETSFKLAYK